MNKIDQLICDLEFFTSTRQWQAAIEVIDELQPIYTTEEAE